MKTLKEWLDEYSLSHMNETNRLIHLFAVPLSMFSLLGLLWEIPLFEIHPLLNPATLFYLNALVFYLSLDIFVFVFMAIKGALFLGAVYYIDQTDYLLEISLATGVISWGLQFWGHRFEGRKPSFLQDFQFILIAPVWMYPFLRNRRE